METVGMIIFMIVVGLFLMLITYSFLVLLIRGGHSWEVLYNVSGKDWPDRKVELINGVPYVHSFEMQKSTALDYMEIFPDGEMIRKRKGIGKGKIIKKADGYLLHRFFWPSMPD